MKGGVNLGYQSEAELEERLMTKLESQGYERIKIEDYEKSTQRSILIR